VFRMEDLAGGVQVVGFPSMYEQAQDLISPDRMVVVKGRVDLRGRELQLVALEIRELNGEEDTTPGNGGTSRSDPLTLAVPAEQCTNGLVTRLKETLASHPGGVPVTLRLTSTDGAKMLRLADGYRVDASAGLLAELRTLLGPEAVASR
jgi:DNA polymerase III subunit alpha